MKWLASFIQRRPCKACQKFKKKCNRAWPQCGLCARHGRECHYDSQPAQLRACYRCAKYKIRCSKNHPKCESCSKKGLDCQYPSLKREHDEVEDASSPDSIAAHSLDGPSRALDDPSRVLQLTMKEGKHGDTLMPTNPSQAFAENLQLEKNQKVSAISENRRHKKKNQRRKKKNTSNDAATDNWPQYQQEQEEVKEDIATEDPPPVILKEKKPKNLRASLHLAKGCETEYDCLMPTDGIFQNQGDARNVVLYYQQLGSTLSEVEVSKCALYLSIFVKRFAAEGSFMVDISGIEDSLARVFLGPKSAKKMFTLASELKNEDHVKDIANFASASAAIMLGAIQTGFLDENANNASYCFMSNILQMFNQVDCEEVMFAHGICSLFCQVIHNTSGSLKHACTLSSMVQSSSLTNLDTRVLPMEAYLFQRSFLSTEKAETDKFVWQKLGKQADLFCRFEEDYPHLNHYSKSPGNSYLTRLEKQLYSNAFEYLPENIPQLLSLPALAFMQKVILHEDASSTLKAQLMQEVVKFVHLSHEYYKDKGCAKASSAVICRLVSTKIILMLFAGRFSDAKSLLEKQVGLFVGDPIFCLYSLTTHIQHHLHFICMALSILEMRAEYDTLKKRVDAMGNFLGLPCLPKFPCHKIQDLCVDPGCGLVWNRLTNPGVLDFMNGLDLSSKLWDVDSF